MRPASIRLFEGLSLLAVAVGALIIWLSWDGVLDYARVKLPGAGIEPALIVLSVIYIGLLVMLILLTSRRGSFVAKWLFVAVSLVTLLVTLPELGGLVRGGAAGWLKIVQLLVQLAGVGFLFTPPSRAWFGAWRAPAGRPPVV